MATPPTMTTFTLNMPTDHGQYWMRCMENGHDPEPVTVYWIETERHGKVLVCDSEVGKRFPVKWIHDGLTEITWRKQESP